MYSELVELFFERYFACMNGKLFVDNLSTLPFTAGFLMLFMHPNTLDEYQPQFRKYLDNLAALAFVVA